jgi:hypothetical protein
MEQEPPFWNLWDRLWGISTQVGTSDSSDMPVFAALNHPRGKLAEALLFRLLTRKLENDGGLPADLKARFDLIADDSEESGVLARVILASRLNNLYLLDRGWTSRHLLSKLDWNCNEAFELWSGYLWAPHSSPDLLVAYKENFLQAVMRSKDFGEHATNLRRLFTAACIHTDGILTASEMSKVIRSFDPKGLADVLFMLSDSLRAAGHKARALWEDKVGPWLKEAWPVAKAKQSEQTSVAMAQMAVNGKEAFPLILEWAQPYIRPAQDFDHIVLRAQENGIVERFPDILLRLLAWLVPEAPPSWSSRLLKEVLDNLRENAPQSVDDANYKKLDAIVQRSQ